MSYFYDAGLVFATVLLLFYTAVAVCAFRYPSPPPLHPKLRAFLACIEPRAV